MEVKRPRPVTASRFAADERGQMTIEFMVMLPVVIIVACIAVNALTFFSDCAAFDVQAKNAIRTYAASPAYGQDSRVAVGKIEGELKRSFAADALSVRVGAEHARHDLVVYRAHLEYTPNLFGMGLKTEVMGVALPRLHHEAALAVDPYKPGMLF